jgi:hypothetical protein
MKKLLLVLALSLLAATAAQASTKHRTCLLGYTGFDDHGADTSIYFPETGQTQNFYTNDTSLWTGQDTDGIVAAAQHTACGMKVLYFYLGTSPSYHLYGTVNLNANVAGAGASKCVGTLDTTASAYQVGYPINYWPADTVLHVDRGYTSESGGPQINVSIFRSSLSAFPSYLSVALNLQCQGDVQTP